MRVSDALVHASVMCQGVALVDKCGLAPATLIPGVVDLFVQIIIVTVYEGLRAYFAVMRLRLHMTLLHMVLQLPLIIEAHIALHTFVGHLHKALLQPASVMIILLLFKAQRQRSYLLRI